MSLNQAFAVVLLVASSIGAVTPSPMALGQEHTGQEQAGQEQAGQESPELETPGQGTLGQASIQVMTWNIWHGGREDGQTVGPKRVVDVIQSAGADVVCMQETYGSGERIAKELGFHFLPRGTNCSILSRHRIVEDISVFEPFKCVGGLIEMPDAKRVAAYSIWLPYNKEIWLAGTRDGLDADQIRAACEASAADLRKIRSAIEKRLSSQTYSNVPIVIAGDFNSMSHLDYVETAKDQFGFAIDWPTSRVLTDAGFRDAYRHLHRTIDRRKDRTWTPRFPDQQQDRIDFIYYQGGSLDAAECRVIDEHPDAFPSDHAAVQATFRWHEVESD